MSDFKVSSAYISIMAPQLPWSDRMIEDLLRMVIIKGGHVASRDKIVEVWESIVEDLFLRPLFAPYKDTHFKKGDKNGVRFVFQIALFYREAP